MKKIYLLLVVLVCVIQSVTAQQIAFPGAEGAGKFTSGGRGTSTVMTTVFEVTNLSDVNSVGSLRYACSQSTTTYPYRTIVFRISGTIHLNSRLNVPKNTTIAGQTAPGDGICIADHSVVMNGDNIIIRYMRFRLGDKNQLKTSPAGCGVPVAPFTAACMPLDGSGGDDALGDAGHKNIIIDHCSVSWSNDEALTMYRGDSLTLQWNMISEPLNYSYHFETGDADFEQHGYGGIWGSLHGTFHHNLFAHCKSRNPRFGGSSNYAVGAIESADFRNNVIYNWGLYTVYGGEGGQYNLVNNYYKYGPSTGVATKYRIVNVDSSATFTLAKYFLSGNYVDGSTTNTNNNWSGAYMLGGNAADTVKSKVYTPFIPGYLPTTTDNALEAYDTVLKNVGCTIPVRDTLDQRIINDVRNRTGKFIDVQGGYPHGTPYAQTVNAWPNLATTTPPTDTDHDGMPDTWENANLLNPNNANDRGLFAANGYTNLENYLNNIQAAPPIVVPSNSASATWILATDQTASVIGSITATDQTLGSNLVGIQYNSTFGTVGSWQRVGTTSNLPVGYNSDTYVEYALTPINGKHFTATSIELGALGGGTGTARMALYYSLDNFATSFPIGNCSYNGSSYDATVDGTPVVLLNTSTTPLTGQQIAVLPTFINVQPNQTLKLRMYVWIVGSGNRYFTSQNVKIDGVTSDVSLPLVLQNFSVKLSNNNALLSWNTSNELSMKEFVVEKSTDGIRFKNVGIVLAKNEVNNQYEFVDAEKMIAKTYYRLKMINQDGSYKYSHIVLLQSNIIQKGISVYPNPASNSITISHAVSSKKSTIKIVNAQGKLVQIVFVAANTSNTTILVQQLPKGLYMLQLLNDLQIEKQLFLKL